MQGLWPLAIVEQHIRFENDHDLEGVLRTVGENARYDDEPWGEHYTGRDGVRAFYQQLMRALPDLEITVQRRHMAEEAILVEVVIRGTHLGDWRGLPATFIGSYPGSRLPGTILRRVMSQGILRQTRHAGLTA